MKTKQETKAKSEGLELTERQVEDFTRLAQLQKDGAANIKDRRLITDAYKAFAAEPRRAVRRGRRPRRQPQGVDRGHPRNPRRDRRVRGERRNDMKKTLAEAIKGMQVKSWEVREHSDGKRAVYVRFAPKEPTLTMNVRGE